MGAGGLRRGRLRRRLRRPGPAEARAATPPRPTPTAAEADAPGRCSAAASAATSSTWSRRTCPPTWTLKEDGTSKNVKWSQPLGSKAYGGPIVSGGKIFVGTNNNTPRNPDVKGDKGILMCFNEADGKFLWQAIHDKLDAGRVNDWPDEGICSSPVVEGDRLWFVSNRCEVLCLEHRGPGRRQQGRAGREVQEQDRRRRHLAAGHDGRAGRLPAQPGRLLAADRRRHAVRHHLQRRGRGAQVRRGPQGAELHRASTRTPARSKWTNNDPGRSRSCTASGPTRSTPSRTASRRSSSPAATAASAPSTPRTARCSGSSTATRRTPSTRSGREATRNDFVCTPVVYDNKLYIGVGQDPEHGIGVGHLWCIDITKEPKNKDKDLSPAAKPSDKPGGKPQTIFDPKDPANKDSGLVWHFGGDAPAGYEGGDYLFGRTMSTCCVHDGLVYAAEYGGFLHCLDAKTGKEYWVHDLKAQTWSSPYYVDGKIYLGDEQGKITVFEPGKEKKILADQHEPPRLQGRRRRRWRSTACST